MRKCKNCKKDKPIEEYHYRNDIQKYRKKCKECRRLHHYDYNLKRRYGISLKDKQSMFEAQGKCCSICGKSGESHRGFHVDHCHTQEKIDKYKCVRGVLCNECNAGLGMFKDNVHNMKKAVEYLEKFEEKLKREEDE